MRTANQKKLNVHGKGRATKTYENLEEINSVGYETLGTGPVLILTGWTLGAWDPALSAETTQGWWNYRDRAAESEGVLEWMMDGSIRSYMLAMGLSVTELVYLKERMI
jgi:hypothetical protein